MAWNKDKDGKIEAAEPPQGDGLDLEIVNAGLTTVPSNSGRYSYWPAQLYHVVVRGGIEQERAYYWMCDTAPNVLAIEPPAHLKQA